MAAARSATPAAWRMDAARPDRPVRLRSWSASRGPTSPAVLSLCAPSIRRPPMGIEPRSADLWPGAAERARVHDGCPEQGSSPGRGTFDAPAVACSTCRRLSLGAIHGHMSATPCASEKSVPVVSQDPVSEPAVPPCCAAGLAADAPVLPLPALDDEEGPRLPAALPPVIDAHVHLFPDRLFEAVWQWFDRYGWPIRYKIHTPAVVAFLLSRGVRRI